MSTRSSIVMNVTSFLFPVTPAILYPVEDKKQINFCCFAIECSYTKTKMHTALFMTMFCTHHVSLYHIEDHISKLEGAHNYRSIKPQSLWCMMIVYFLL